MKIIVTMAGLGSRFLKVGIVKPKYKIIANGKSLFEWSMISLTDFFNEEFIFVVRREILDSDFIYTVCERLGINKFIVVVAEQTTDGQAATAMLANQLISDDDPVAIYNIDTYVSPNSISKSDIDPQYDGYIPTVRTSGDRWSFVRINEFGQLIEIAEKVPISDLATIGFYYFKKWREFVRVYEASKDSIKQKYREVYVAPMYASYITENKHVGVSILDSSAVYILGTPEEIEAFDHNYLSANQ